MNSVSTFAIFVVVSFAYNGTPAQGQTLNVDEAVFKNGQKCFSNPDKRRHTTLTKYWDSPNWELKETTPLRKVTELSIEMKDFHTMMWNTVLLETSLSPLRIRFSAIEEAQQLYDMVDLPRRSMRSYMYRVTRVYKYKEEVDLPGYGLSISGYAIRNMVEPYRYIVHSGGTETSIPNRPDCPIKPFLLWTSKKFNYCDFDKKSIIVTLLNSVDGTYEYYLISFTDRLDLRKWKRNFGREQFVASTIPKADANPEILSYFSGVYVYIHGIYSDESD